MKFKNLLRLFFIPLMIGICCSSFLLPFLSQPTHAVDLKICDIDNIPEEIKKANGCPSAGGATLPTLAETVQTILQNIIIVIGIVAVIFIVVGGIQYMTSSGDANKLQKAKNTILYSCIGLAICALAFAAVNFVISDIIKTNSVDCVGGTVDPATGAVTCPPDDFKNSVITIINGVILVLGFVCVGVVLVGGINYMTSSGDASKAQKARTTIYSGLIGLTICAFAFGVVDYVIKNMIGTSAVEEVGGGDDILDGVLGVMNGIISVLGFVCVGVLIYGGVNYMTSAGDTNKVQKARNCILYGAIGLAICAFSIIIVNFVIVNIIGGQNTSAPTITNQTDCNNAGGTWIGGACQI